MQQNNYGYNGYYQQGTPTGFQPDFDPYQAQRKRQKKEIFNIGCFVGAALLSFLMLQNAVVIFLYVFGIYDKYLSDPIMQTGIEIISSIFCILLPFYIFGKIMSSNYSKADILPLDKPKDRRLGLLAVPFGLGVCMIANIVTSYIVLFMSFFGVELTSPEMLRPDGAVGFILSVIKVAVTAAVAEEISLRGCVMQNLRRYGDSFAIVMSAVTFGIMHMNMVQAPFAIIVGLILGYITVKTESIWPAIIVHSLNNLFSTVVSYLADWGVRQELINAVYSFIIYALIAVGAICGLLFIKRVKQISYTPKPGSVLTTGEKTKAFLISPTLIIAFLIMIYYTAQYIKLG
ncbi:MAG: lysostaphin resistance A-like protein [Acutalibacteraceae bacterium]